MGSALTPRSWAAHLSARTGCRVVLPEYRLAPEHPYPAALEDARAILAALSAEAGPGSVVVSGDSAGGGLALALVLSLRDEGQDLPAGCILLSPWLDLGRDRRAVPDLVRRDVVLTPDWLEACARAYAAPAAWAGPSVSPLCAGHAGLPPLLIQAGTDELLAPDAEAAGRQRLGRRDGRDLHPVAAHVARLRPAARPARRGRQRAGRGRLVRRQGADGGVIALRAATARATCMSGQSTTSYPPICSFVSANGPSQTSSSSSRTRTILASRAERSGPPLGLTPRSVMPSTHDLTAIIMAVSSSAVTSAASSTQNSSMYFMALPIIQTEESTSRPITWAREGGRSPRPGRGSGPSGARRRSG